MAKVAGKVGFDQKAHEKTGVSHGTVNKQKVGFVQPGKSRPAGKTTHKTPGKVVGVQGTSKAGMNAASTKKNPGKLGWDKPNHGGSVTMPKAGKTSKAVAKKMGKVSGTPSVAPKMSSINDLLKYRKKKYGA